MSQLELALGARDPRRRAFVNRENDILGRFLGADDQRVIIGWRRHYRCACGFACTAPGAIFDHTARCVPVGEAVGGQDPTEER